MHVGEHPEILFGRLSRTQEYHNAFAALSSAEVSSDHRHVCEQAITKEQDDGKE